MEIFIFPRTKAGTRAGDPFSTVDHFINFLIHRF